MMTLYRMILCDKVGRGKSEWLAPAGTISPEGDVTRLDD